MHCATTKTKHTKHTGKEQLYWQKTNSVKRQLAAQLGNDIK